MKRLLRKPLNIVAYSALIIALYLNFVHKDSAIPDFSSNNQKSIASTTSQATTTDKVNLASKNTNK